MPINLLIKGSEEFQDWFSEATYPSSLFPAL